MIKPVAYFVIGLFSGLIVSELMKDAKPVNRINIYDSYRVRYKYPPRYLYGYDYYYRPLEYRVAKSQQYSSRNDEKHRGGRSGERGETHSTTRQVNDRKKN